MILSQVIYLMLIVFAILTIAASCLKHAIILSSVFGLWASLAYLLYHAPDVSVSEAVVSSTLGTILLVLTIRKYTDVSLPPFRQLLRIRLSALFLLTTVCGLLIYFTVSTPSLGIAPLQVEIMESYFASQRIVSPVTSILLSYRVFDTVFEASMLLVAVLAVVHLTDTGHRGGAAEYLAVNEMHPTLRTAVRVLVPILFVVGAAMIIGDPFTPGGGFQGGGILAAIVVGRYLVRPYSGKRTDDMQKIEKLVFVLFVLSIIAYVLLDARNAGIYPPFMLLMNALLGVKVFCGLSIMFLFFAAEE
ncbi:MAG: DUF4040 domain-containing protein [Cellulomonadaceae bacterium]|jgi:multicomponent Na+:H+ antiporter subunit B|nr:DUF4040 domain-containing protein [Cellulomonadaceae bacterium]